MQPTLLTYSRQDKFGYYLVGNEIKTYSKVEAIEVSNRLRKPVRWVFNEDVFLNFDWKTEPTETLEELYAQRARQIREQYDYIVVWYSGGADSHNVLQSFIKNDIFVDEIAQFHSHDGDKTWDSYLNAEVEKVAIPVTKELLNTMPGTKHRVVDLTDLVGNLYGTDSNAHDFIYMSNKVFAPNQLARTYLRERIADYQNLIKSGKRVCFVWGADKVRVHQAGDRYYVHFLDFIDAYGVGPRTQQLNRDGEFDELFYWSPDCPKLVAKQAHLVKNYLLNPPATEINSRWLSNSLEETCTQWTGRRILLQSSPTPGTEDQQMFITRDGLHRIIYPDWDPDTFTLGKPASSIFTPRDGWWLKDTNGDFQKKYLAGIVKLRQILGLPGKTPASMDYGIESMMTIANGDMSTLNVRPMYSPRYWLN